jgi:hypothetical protein
MLLLYGQREGDYFAGGKGGLPEPSARREASHGYFLVFACEATGWKDGPADRSEVGTCGWETWVKDFVVGTQTDGCGARCVLPCDARISAGHEDRHALKTELHELVTLPGIEVSMLGCRWGM